MYMNIFKMAVQRNRCTTVVCTHSHKTAF